MRKIKVIHVELNEPYQGRKHWYFGSVSAIYERLTREQVGCVKEYLWAALKGKAEYRTRGAIIRKGELITKQQKGGSNENERNN